jgi:glycosyltransferase involved in cell wall biosynthesis
LPANVRVHSLGKEKGSVPSFVYAMRFKWLAWEHRSEYDAVFVHMNQEYLLVAGPMWKLLRKPIYFWRNHYAGSFLTDLAAAFCTKIFYTSQHSYTAKYEKAVRMPVGVNLERFDAALHVRREPHSILFLARINPSKHPDMLIEALGLLLARGVSFVASIYGSPLPEHEAYYANLQAQAERLGLHDRVRFHPGVPNEQAPSIYQAHDIFVNCSKSGMYDKTLFEAAASGCLVLAASDDFKDSIGPDVLFDGTPEDLAIQIERLLRLSDTDRAILSGKLRRAVQENGLAALVTGLARELQ